ncbi:MAG TPA: ABC transporter permease [Bryobacteraceae bacterium]|nr:ABC transporter permease [Bryobacteraceae bacterium]
MNALVQDFRFALRTLWKTPAFTAIAFLALALGIGANSAIFTVVNSVLLHPLPFPDSSRICHIYTQRFGDFTGIPDAAFVELKKQSTTFQNIAAISGGSTSLTGLGEPTAVHGAAVTWEFWGALGVGPSRGRTFGASDIDNVAVIGDKLWRSRFNADPSILGKVVKLEGAPHTIIGIMPAGFGFPADAELWTPLIVKLQENRQYAYNVIGRMKPGSTVGQALAETKTIAQRLDPRAKDAGASAGVVPLHEFVVGKIRPSLYVLLGAVGFILLIACANVANLLLARGSGRQQEIAVRASLGASRFRLIRQLLTESTLLAIAGGALGLLLALWGVPLLVKLVPAGLIPRLAEVGINGQILVFTFGLSLATSLIFGLAPALTLSKAHLADSLKQDNRRMSGSQGLRSVLVTCEIALSLVLLIGAGLMIKSFVRLSSVDPGFHPESAFVITTNLPESDPRGAKQLIEYHDQVVDKLAALPGVTSAGAINWLPMGDAFVQGDFYTEAGARPAAHFTAAKPSVTPGYFPAMGIRLLNGRLFDNRDTENSTPVAIVTQSLARRAWGDANPLGKRVTLEDHPQAKDWLTVIGVVDDVKQHDLAEKKPLPTVYQPIRQVTFSFFLNQMSYVVRANGNDAALPGLMRSRFRELDPNQPIQLMSTMSEMVSATTAEPRFYSRMLGSFSAIALLLASLGIYGVMAYSVAQRTREIGIRVALGAQRADIFRSVMLRSAFLVSSGVALGLAGAFGITRVLSKLLFEVKPTDAATFTAVSVLLILVALAATYIPARRATSVDPMVALRYE